MTNQTRRSLLGLGMKSLGVAALAGIGRVSGQTGGSSNRVLISIELLGGERGQQQPAGASRSGGV